MSRFRPIPFVAAALAAVSLAIAGLASAAGSAICDLTVVPGAPVAEAIRSLSPGQKLCLAGGVHVEDVTIRKGGAPGAPIEITSAPDAIATLRGRLWIADSANDVVVSNLRLEGTKEELLPSPTVNGDRIVFRGNDVTNHHTTICFVIGNDGPYGIAVDVVIEGNRIHNCGELPATNHHHGIYLVSSRNARIVNNLIYDNADRGIQFYPEAHDTLVQGNVIDSNGQGVLFAGDGGVASNGNRVVGNVISNSTLRYNVESWYPEGNPIGRDNVAERNCLWNGRRGNLSSEWGFRASANVTADPLFLDRAAKDFRLRAGSRCAGLLGAPEQVRASAAVFRSGTAAARKSRARPASR